MIKIKDFEIDNFNPPYIIAELAANHNGDINLAKKLIDEAKEIGCQCVKFQSWTVESIFSEKVYKDNYFLNDDYRNRKDYTLKQIVEQFSLSEADFIEIKKYCDMRRIDFACTPFSEKEVDFLVNVLDVNFIKIASMDCNNYHFIEYIAKKQKPIMLSTGLSSLYEIDKAIEVIESAGNKDIIILHCVSHYPPEDDEINLNNIDMLRMNYPDYPIGFSDHTLGIEIPLAAVAKGAAVIEKHFTLDKNMFGWDHKISADKNEMKAIVNGAKKINRALGNFRRIVSQKDIEKRKAFRRSIVSKRKIKKGERISLKDITFKRPGTGIKPSNLNNILGRKVNKEIEKDELIYFEDLE